MNIIEILAKAIAEHGLSMMIPIVTLLTFTHLRAVLLSGRVRENVNEMLYDVSKLTEENSIQSNYRKSLKKQTDVFLARHKSLSMVFIMLTITLLLAMFSIPLCGSQSYNFKILGLFFSAASITCLFFALFILGKEFMAGASTLKEHAAIMNNLK